MLSSDQGQPPVVLAGPILRRLTPQTVCLWLCVYSPVTVRLELFADDRQLLTWVRRPGETGLRHLAAGEHAHYLFLEVPTPTQLPFDTWIDYRLSLDLGQGNGWQSIDEWMPDLCYPGRDLPGFLLPSRVGSLVHGSCRKPHHASEDGLVALDGLLARCAGSSSVGEESLPPWPSMLVMSGDQIYADDVAGPMLRAVHALIHRLGFGCEQLTALGVSSPLPDDAALYTHPDTYYRRESMLPSSNGEPRLLELIFGGVRKPVFTADNAHNHLITLAEVLAMYLLVWSPVAWAWIDFERPGGLSGDDTARYDREWEVLQSFIAGLSAVRRVLAHLPVAMIFDDHDVSDDWNLNRDWEETAYGHPFSRRMIGNALIGYLINQGWGNRPEVFDDQMFAALQMTMNSPGEQCHDDLIDRLLRFEGWDYHWPTEPLLVVLDTRTRRWRSESGAHKPSGLLDWEAVTDLQRSLRERDSVLLVSAAPIFGVKLIEAFQRVFTWIGKPLTVDAEYWMAHPGTSAAILNVFRHPKTPSRFVVLSGDVHYSFVYDVELRGRIRGPDIWQVCSSGIKNEFPVRLLDVLDRLNRWLYSPRSPLNWFTRRRRLRVVPRKPQGTPSGRRLLNASGIGVLELDAEGAPTRIRQLLSDGSFVTFVRREDEARWD